MPRAAPRTVICVRLECDLGAARSRVHLPAGYSPPTRSSLVQDGWLGGIDQPFTPRRKVCRRCQDCTYLRPRVEPPSVGPTRSRTRVIIPTRKRPIAGRHSATLTSSLRRLARGHRPACDDASHGDRQLARRGLLANRAIKFQGPKDDHDRQGDPDQVE